MAEFTSQYAIGDSVYYTIPDRETKIRGIIAGVLFAHNTVFYDVDTHNQVVRGVPEEYIVKE